MNLQLVVRLFVDLGAAVSAGKSRRVRRVFLEVREHASCVAPTVILNELRRASRLEQDGGKTLDVDTRVIELVGGAVRLGDRNFLACTRLEDSGAERVILRRELLAVAAPARATRTVLVHQAEHASF